MRSRLSALLLLCVCVRSDGFRPQASRSSRPQWSQELSRAVKSAFLATSLGLGLVSAPALRPPAAIAAPAPAGKLSSASAAGSRVNKDAESLLRYALPVKNKEVRELQAAVEDVKGQIAIRQWSAGTSDVQKAMGVLKSKAAKILAAVPQEKQKAVQGQLDMLGGTLEDLRVALAADGAGEVKGETKLKTCYDLQDKAANTVGAIEENMIPTNYHVQVPKEYNNLPQLDGRAKVQFVFKKGEPGEKFDLDGVLVDTVTLEMVADGYNSPITAGNFVDLVHKGFYNNMAINRADGFVVQTGEPKDATEKTNGYVPPGSSEVRRIPLEIALLADKDPFYSTTIDEDGRGGEPSRLPFQSTGALGMARAEYDNDSASSQFFWLLFESDLTPAGKNMMDGRYACFGYTTKGADYLPAIKAGDVVVSAKVLDGLDNLKAP